MMRILTWKEFRILCKIASISELYFEWDTRIDDSLLHELSKWVSNNTELDKILDSLYDKGYFIRDDYAMGIIGGRAFKLTYDGKNIKKICLYEAITSIIKSIIIPVIVSIITVLIKDKIGA